MLDGMNLKVQHSN